MMQGLTKNCYQRGNRGISFVPRPLRENNRGLLSPLLSFSPTHVDLATYLSPPSALDHTSHNKGSMSRRGGGGSVSAHCTSTRTTGRTAEHRSSLSDPSEFTTAPRPFSLPIVRLLLLLHLLVSRPFRLLTPSFHHFCSLQLHPSLFSVSPRHWRICY